MTRPPSQPDFERAPLNEFVMGVQFAQPHGYQQIYAGEVWSLFRSDFPKVQEQPALPPTFETFGLPQSQTIDFGLVGGANHDRFWFLSPSGQQLLQFQHDKFLHNWREIDGQIEKYPRFENLIERYHSELITLDSYMRKFESRGLQINQAEISYVNHIRAPEGSELEPDEWLSFLRLGKIDPNDFQVGFRQTISHLDGRPLGRIYCEAVAAFEANGRPLIRLSLTARGAPASPGIEGALEFLSEGRKQLGALFLTVTTESAQRAWGRNR